MVDQMNTGSFGAPIGGGNSLLEAMKRRGISASALQQMSPGSAGGGVPMPQDPSQLGMAQSAMAGSPQEMSQTAGVTEPAPQPQDAELGIALTALADFTKGKVNMQRDLVKAKTQGIV